MKSLLWRENCLAECAAKMALIGKASAMDCFSQLRVFTQQTLGKIDPSVLQIAIGAGAKQRPEITRKLPTVTASHLLKLLQSRTGNDGGFEEFARAHHGCSVGCPYSCRPSRRIVHGLRQIVERVFISSGILDALAVDDYVKGGRDQSGICRDAIGEKR